MIHYAHSVVLYDAWWDHSHSILERQEEQLKEQERRRLSEELHDETLAELAGVATELFLMARRAAEAPSDLAADLNELRVRVRGTESRLREIVRGIFPSTLTNLGLLPALHSFLEELAARSQDSETPLRVQISASGFKGDRLPEQVELAAYRVIQQGVTNAVQHANATRMSIELAWAESELKLTIADDGVGFDVDSPEGTPTSGHFGLTNLKSRIESVEGQLQIESEESVGTTIRARIPVPERPSPSGEGQSLTFVLGKPGLT